MLFTCAISGDRRVDGRVHGLRLRRARRVHLRQLPLAQAVKPIQGVLFNMMTLLNDNISYHFYVTQISWTRTASASRASRSMPNTTRKCAATAPTGMLNWETKQ